MTDDLADTIDYGALADDLAAIVAGEPFDLIEALAGALADRCLAVCTDVEVTVRKPQAPIAHAFTDVAVTLRRTRADTDVPDANGRPGVDDHVGDGPAAGGASAQWRAVVALGANLGDALGTLQDAAHALDLHPRISVLAGSPVYVTEPVGGVEQPDFHNAAVLIETSLPPHQLLAVCQGIEVAAGRTREVRWGPRTLDLDIVRMREVVGTAAVDTAVDAGPHTDADPHTGTDVRLAGQVLTLPHPRAGERAFVLAPWADLEPDATVETPHGAAPITTALAHAGDGDGVRRTDALVWSAGGGGR